MTIKLPFRKLAASALFASTDETRIALTGVCIEPKQFGVLLIATDARRIAFIRHECTPDPNFIKPVSIPAALINRLGIRTADEIYLDEDIIERQPTEPPSRDCMVTVTGKDVSIRLEGSHGVIGSLIDYPFPPVMQVIPTTPPEAYKVSSFSARFMEAYQTAGRWLSPHAGAVLWAGHGKFAKCDHANVYSVRLNQCPDFYSVLMPVKVEETLEAVAVPDWLKA